LVRFWHIATFGCDGPLLSGAGHRKTEPRLAAQGACRAHVGCKQFEQIEHIIRSTIATLLPNLASGLGVKGWECR